MKNLWKISFSLLAFCMFSANLSSAQNHNVNQQEIDALNDMNFVEMLNSVELDSKSAELIVKFQDKEGRNRLHKGVYNATNGCTVETFRNKEVLLITIPVSKLFGPNETELRDGADKFLNPLKKYLKGPDMYRMLIVMHTDNTGSEVYREQITDQRADAVVDWFENTGLPTDYLFSYAQADDSPLVPNNSIDNREKNRRLEVYLVPGKKMLSEAKKGRIEF